MTDLRCVVVTGRRLAGIGACSSRTIDPQARQWKGAKGRSGALPDGGEVVFTGARAAQFDPAETEGGKGVVRFFADGAATGGRVRMLANGGGWDVDVGWLTGEVRVSRVRAP